MPWKLVESETRLIAALTDSIRTLDALVVNQQVPQSIFSPSVTAALNSLASQFPEKTFLVDSRDKLSEFRSMVCKVNAIEAAALFGRSIRSNEDCGSDELRTYAGSLFGQSRRPVFITRSGHGLLSYDGTNYLETPAIKPAGPIDPVGAGDTVVAAVAASLAAGADVQLAGSVAMLAAAVTVRKLCQTGTASPAELLQLESLLPTNPRS